MTDNPLPIDPTKPVAGNFRGTFAGFVAFAISGYIAKLGFFTTCASYICDDLNTSSPLSCDNAEWMMAVFFMALVGSAVNYAVTHFSQVKNLSELYAMIPQIYPAGMTEKNAGSKTGKSL